MLRLARTGATIVRLKGGDPSIFGRAAEERAFLERAGVSVEVIPGITTASAAAAEFGFSLTTRAGARRVVLATGRTLDGAADDWAALADPANTLCLYMGCADIAAISADLIHRGLPACTPAIAAIDVSRPVSRLLSSTIGTLATELAADRITGPVFICIGNACADARSAEKEVSLLRAAGPQAC
jgi:uroporphyrin-III C-methyltransferase